MPFGTECDGHVWLHPECWILWSGKRRKKALKALATMGLYAPSDCTNEANFPDDFGKINKTQD